MLRYITLVLALASTTAGAQTLNASATYTLDAALCHTNSNFHPQGLGVDESTGRLLYAQKNSGGVYSSALDGTDIQLFSNASISYNTSVAYWQGYVYLTDYQGNASGQDLYKAAVPTGSAVGHGSHTAGYGGFPIDIRNGELYRTNYSSSYSWSNLNQIIVSGVASPNSASRSITLSGTSGIGDIAIDLDSNSVWILEFTSSARIHRFDLTSGQLLATSQAVGDGLDAGLTYYNGDLYYYDWVSGSGSTLTVFPTGFSAGCTDGMDPVDIDEDGDDDSCIHSTATIADSVTVEPGAHVHANAIIAPRAVIGSSAKVGAGSIVGRFAEVRGTLVGTVIVGRSAQVLNGSTIADGSVIGYASVVDNSDLGPNTIVGSIATIVDSSVGDDGGVGNAVLSRDTTVQTGSLVGSGTVVGPGSEFTTSDLGADIRVRKGCIFSAGSSVGDDARVGRNVTLGANGAIAASSRIGAESDIGANACASGTVARSSVITICP